LPYTLRLNIGCIGFQQEAGKLHRSGWPSLRLLQLRETAQHPEMHPGIGRWRCQDILECRGITGGSGMSTVPQELNWVKARSECSVGRVFCQLFIEAEQDVKDINLLSTTPPYPAPVFSVQGNSEGNCIVVFEAGNTNALVKFQLGLDRIVITMLDGKQLRLRSLSIMMACAN